MKDTTELTGKKAPALNAPVIGGSYREGDTVSLADLKVQPAEHLDLVLQALA